jgi:hypothetical protein
MNKLDKDLKSVLKRGGGMSLIVSMVECPNCNKDIWVEMGSHCGFDAFGCTDSPLFKQRQR